MEANMKARRLHLAVLIGTFICISLLCFAVRPTVAATLGTPAVGATSTPAGGMTSTLSAPTAKITGKIIEAGSGLPLSGVRVVAEGPTTMATTTDANGNFTFDNLIVGSYSLIASLKGFETTSTDPFPLTKGQTQDLSIAIQKTRGNSAGVKVLGRLQIHGSASLQTAAVISSTVSAQSMARQGIYRGGDQLLKLPSVTNGTSSGATPGDALSVDIRGIGELETITMIDGNPIGPGFGGAYSFQLSPVFGLQDIKVLYGSGSDLYGVDAIGGVVDMQTLSPTLHPTATFTQGYGTWNNLTTALTTTGSTTGGKFGYAAAFGTQGQTGYFKHDNMYQASAAFDPYAVDPAVRGLGVYSDDTSLTNKSTLLKGRVNFSDTSHVTAAWLSSAWWDDKTANGDNDYLPYDVALASGRNQLSAAASSGGADTCYNANPATFTAGTNTNGSAPGTGPGGVSDIPGHVAGAPLCITPQQFAYANDGWQGAGTAWNALRSNVYSLRYEQTNGNNTVSLNTFANIYRDSVDRTHQLPFFAVPSDNPSWTIEQATNTGLTLSDDILAKNNEFGLGYFWENSAYYFLTGMPAPIGGQEQPAPITHQTAYFLRDAWHPVNSRLTTYGNVWFKHSTVTNSSFVDPRISFVYTQGNNVLRVAGGQTSTEPRPSQIESVFQPTAVGVFNGNVVCSGLNPVGAVPSSELRPETGVDQEFSYGHRFAGDSTMQLTLYNENIFQQIYDSLTLPLSALTVPFDPTPYANAVAKGCGIPQAQALALLGVSGSINIGHSLASGIDFTGRIRVSSPLYIDYSYDTMSIALKSSDPSLINPTFGGMLSLIPNAQLPNIPLHKWSFTLDYTFWRDIEAQLETYHESENNQHNLPAFTASNLSIGVPIGAGTFTTTVSNLWQTYADYRGLIGEGYPLALNSFAQPSDYQPFLGAQTTERFGLPLRTIQFNYSIKVK
jgi:outer membrane receptor protein involved in Fe transport